MIILGIDPGSRITGYGLINVDGGSMGVLECGALKTGGGEFPARLKVIFEGVFELIERHRPAEMAIERVFVSKNADSALKLGQARGAAICAGVQGALTVAEYSPREIKQAVVGKGSADKEQVQHMIRVLLGLRSTPQADAADALAVAICHSHVSRTRDRTGVTDWRRR